MMRAAKLRKAIQIDEWLQEEARLAGKKVEPNTYAEGRTWYNWERAEAITNFAGPHLDTITSLDDAVGLALAASADAVTQALIKGETPILVVEQEPVKPKPAAKPRAPRKPQAYKLKNDDFDEYLRKFETLRNLTSTPVAVDLLHLWYGETPDINL